MSIYTDLGLDRTVRVGISHVPEWGAIAQSKKVGLIERGVKVPHKAANLYRFGNARLVATPFRVVHTERFKPNTVPAGLDMTITIPHDCANHLDDVAAMATEAFRRGR